jgi:hypothetical protein
MYATTTHIDQAYFTWRAWIVSNKAWYSSPPWFVELARVGVILQSCVYLARAKTVDEFNDTHSYIVTIVLASCIFVCESSPFLEKTKVNYT